MVSSKLNWWYQISIFCIYYIITLKTTFLTWKDHVLTSAKQAFCDHRLTVYISRIKINDSHFHPLTPYMILLLRFIFFFPLCQEFPVKIFILDWNDGRFGFVLGESAVNLRFALFLFLHRCQRRGNVVFYYFILRKMKQFNTFAANSPSRSGYLSPNSNSPKFLFPSNADSRNQNLQQTFFPKGANEQISSP